MKSEEFLYNNEHFSRYVVRDTCTWFQHFSYQKLSMLNCRLLSITSWNAAVATACSYLGTLVLVPFSFIIFPNDAPLSVLAFKDGSKYPVLSPHQMTNTLLPDAVICAVIGVVIFSLNATVLSKVFPLSVLLAKNTCQCPVSLLVHATYMLFPEDAEDGSRIWTFAKADSNNVSVVLPKTVANTIVDNRNISTVRGNLGMGL